MCFHFFIFSSIFRYDGLTFYQYRDRIRIQWNRIFSRKQDWTLYMYGHYRDGYCGIGFFVEKQNWILCMYVFMETGYEHSGKESRIGSCTFLVF